MQQLHEVRGILVDLDGTLIRGGAVMPGALELLNQFENRFIVVSNDAEHMPEQLSRALRALKLRIPPDRIVLAGTAALDQIAAEQPGAKVMLLSSSVLRTYGKRLGLQLSDERPDIVVLARDRRFSFAKLAKAANAVRAGAELVATNPDLTQPGANGHVVPETGALLSAVLSCAGPVPYRVIGKPEPGLFQAGLGLLGTRPEDTIVIGDNQDTDGAGAQRLGMRFIHVDAGQVFLRPEVVGIRMRTGCAMRTQLSEARR